jgi:putative two-component system hydrogenase maturation factor HypX/HoxX
MHKSFFGFDQSYHVARFNFVTKVPKSRTPATIAFHRRMAPNPVSTRLAI